MSKNRVSDLSHESSCGMLEWEDNWLFILKKKEKWVNKHLFPFLYVFISECMAEIKYKGLSPVYGTEKKQYVHTPTKPLGNQQFSSNTLEWLTQKDVIFYTDHAMCTHFYPLHSIGFNYILEGKAAFWEDFETLTSACSCKMWLEKQGGEHREPQGLRTMIQSNHIDILVKEWERNMSTGNRNRFRTWLSKPSASRQWDPRSYRETRDDDSSLCKKQTHGPYTHYREQRTAWLLSARSQVILGVCISSVS